MKLLDTHQHLICRDRFDYGWTNGIAVLEKGNFDLACYQDLTSDAEVVGTIFMESAVDDTFYQDEARFVAELAKDKGSGIFGIIASARLETDVGFEAWLEECIELGIHGLRRILHVVDDTMSQTDGFRKNLRKIGERGLVFDLCFLQRQLPIAIELARACDNTTLVLDHCGVPDIVCGDFDDWANNITKLAALPNVSCKLSGLLAYTKPGEHTLATVRPYVDHALESFGADRVVWGSDWPVVDMAKGLVDWLDVSRQILMTLSESEASAIGYRNALRIYGCSQLSGDA